jgi:ribonucleoside-diphosphate reductase alpha chain
MLTETGERISRLKYSIGGKEPWEAIALRVASHIAKAEKSFGKTDEEELEITNKFFQMIYNLYFIPGGRILANAGTGITSLMNCLSLPLEDTRQSIYETLKDAAEIFANGGGVGYSLSKIREEGAPVVTTNGKASGPLSFLSLFDQTGEVISEASRRGAQLAALSVNHPDIEKFIDFKAVPNSRNKRILDEYDRNLKSFANSKLKDTKYYNVLEKTLLDDQLTHFNLSVAITDDFMKCVVEDAPFDLVSINTPKRTTINAKALLYKIAKQAHASGDPGLLFLDRINEDSMTPYLGRLETTNPWTLKSCGLTQ